MGKLIAEGIDLRKGPNDPLGTYMNLRLKRSGTGLQISLEPINTRFPDDRFSSLCIGLRRIKEIEEEEVKGRKRGGPRKLVFFSGGRNGK